MADRPLNWWIYVGLGALWFLSVSMLEWLEAGSSSFRWTMAIFIAGFALACYYNGRRCGAIHCKINAPAYSVVALVAGLSALGMFALDMWTILGAFLVVTTFSYAVERLTGHKRQFVA